MSIASEIIRSICSHECAHAVVARALGAHLDFVEVFNISGDGIKAHGTAGYWHTDLKPADLATIAIASEVGEQIMTASPDYRYPLALRLMSGAPMPGPNDLLPPHLLGDGQKFLQRAKEHGATNLFAFLDECQARARKLLQANLPEFNYRVNDTIAYATNAKVQDRIPPDGIVPGDGEHWYFRYPNRPVMKTMHDLVTQFLEFNERRKLN